MGELLNLALAFFISGVIGFGGGVASIALINSLVVDTFSLVSQEYFNIIITISNSLPGPVATLLALGTGYSVYGIIGGIVAVVALVLPSAVVVILLYNVLMKYRNDYRVKRISKYIFPIIIALFIQLIYRFLKQSFVGINNTYATLFLLITTFILFYKFKIHPGILIFGAMIFGYFLL